MVVGEALQFLGVGVELAIEVLDAAPVAEAVLRVMIDEGMIEQLVHGFYAQVREDPLLGPVFGAHVKDWGTHLPKMVDFWSSALRKTARYRGTPIEAIQEFQVITNQFDAEFGRTAGAIVGKALWEGRFALEEALEHAGA